MSTGKLLFAGLVALVLAVGASSTAEARSRYSFTISSGYPGWGYPAYGYAPVGYGYGPVVGPAYYVPPPPPVYYYPRYYRPYSGFSFSYYGW